EHDPAPRGLVLAPVPTSGAAGARGHVGLRPYHDLSEARDLRITQHLLDAALVVLGVGLLQQHPARHPLVPAVELALDDLGNGGLGLALVAGLGLQAEPLLLDLFGGNLVPGDVAGPP